MFHLHGTRVPIGGKRLCKKKICGPFSGFAWGYFGTWHLNHIIYLFVVLLLSFALVYDSFDSLYHQCAEVLCHHQELISLSDPIPLANMTNGIRYVAKEEKHQIWLIDDLLKILWLSQDNVSSPEYKGLMVMWCKVAYKNCEHYIFMWRQQAKHIMVI